MSDLSDEQKQALDDMVERRVANTGETTQVARQYIADYLVGYATMLSSPTIKRWEVGEHTYIDKAFYIFDPKGLIEIKVDYDDVNREDVDARAEEIVRYLNFVEFGDE